MTEESQVVRLHQLDEIDDPLTAFCAGVRAGSWDRPSRRRWKAS